MTQWSPSSAPEGRIEYKVFHEDGDWRTLPVRSANIVPEDIGLTPMYTSRLKISTRKFHDPQYMKKVLPFEDQSFNDQLEFVE